MSVHETREKGATQAQQGFSGNTSGPRLAAPRRTTGEKIDLNLTPPPRFDLGLFSGGQEREVAENTIKTVVSEKGRSIRPRFEVNWEVDSRSIRGRFEVDSRWPGRSLFTA